MQIILLAILTIIKSCNLSQYVKMVFYYYLKYDLKSSFHNSTFLLLFFLSRGVLGMQMSDGLNELGYPKWQLALCVFIVYVMLYLSLFKGVKSSGKYLRCKMLNDLHDKPSTRARFRQSINAPIE